MQAPASDYPEHAMASANLAAPRASSYPGLEAVFATHTQGIDTFGNVGQLR